MSEVRGQPPSLKLRRAKEVRGQKSLPSNETATVLIGQDLFRRSARPVSGKLSTEQDFNNRDNFRVTTADCCS